MKNHDAWLQHVKDNQSNLLQSVEDVRSNWPSIRNVMAEQGVEVTPIELEELTTLIEDSLCIVEGDNWEHG